jgi:hypothetical protein
MLDEISKGVGNLHQYASAIGEEADHHVVRVSINMHLICTDVRANLNVHAPGNFKRYGCRRGQSAVGFGKRRTAR